MAAGRGFEVPLLRLYGYHLAPRKNYEKFKEQQALRPRSLYKAP
jgi:hypothetical protein